MSTLNSKNVQAIKSPELGETELLQVFDKSFIGMLITAPDGRWIKVNTHFCDMLGYKSEELTEKKFNAFTHPEDLGIGTTQLQLLLSGEIEHFEVEKRYIHKLGHAVEVLVNSTVIKDANGELKYFISQAKDISAIKKNMEALRISEEKFRSIFEKAPIGIAHFDEKGNITTFNKVLMNILGAAREKISQVKTETDLKDQAHKAALKEALQGRISSYEGNYTSVLSGKTTYLKTIYAPLFSPDGKVIGGTSISEDITERKLSEEKIQSSLKEKELLIKEVYHRAKNNLQTTISLINIQINESNSEELISALQETKSRLYAMSRVHEVLCRTENLDYILLRTYINDLVSNFEFPKVSYQVNIEKSLTLSIDQTNSVGLIVNELITNSIKHNPARELVILISIKTTDGGKIMFNYSDNGPGIDAEIKNVPSSALGMNLVKVLVEEQLNGTMKWPEKTGFHILITF